MYVIRIEFKMEFNSRFNKNITWRKTLVRVWFFLPNHLRFENTGEQVSFLGVSAYASPPHAPTTPKPEKGKDLREKLEVCSMPSACISYRVLHAKVLAINWSYVYDLEYLHENALSRPKKGRTVSENQ